MRRTDPWGIKVVLVELKHIDLPRKCNGLWRNKQKRSAKDAQKLSIADGEFQALAKARRRCRSHRQAAHDYSFVSCRASSEVSVGKNSTTIFPVPIDLLTPFLKKATQHKRFFLLANLIPFGACPDPLEAALPAGSGPFVSDEGQTCMNLKEFKYELPEFPDRGISEPRSTSLTPCLVVKRNTGELIHGVFFRTGEFFRSRRPPCAQRCEGVSCATSRCQGNRWQGRSFVIRAFSRGAAACGSLLSMGGKNRQ